MELPNEVLAARALFHRGSDNGVPIQKNDVGFNRPDYYLVKSHLARFEEGQASATDLWALGNIVRKYHRQLIEVGIDVATLHSERYHELRGHDPLTPPPPPAPPPVVSEGPRQYAEGLDLSVVEPRPAAPIPPMESILGPDGVIAQALAGYQPRPTQIQLAQKIASAIANDTSLLAEAGTGTGKSLAYLIAAIYSGRKTIVSTEGKALQDQLIGKDLPFLRQVLPKTFSYGYVKGIGNYLCRLKLDQELEADLSSDDLFLKNVVTWSKESEQGDLAEVAFAVGPRDAQRITSSSHECLGQHCPFESTCFGLRARKRAEVVDVVVVNHTLLALDIALRDKTADHVAILPDRDLIVLDEAHGLEEVATTAFTTEVSEWATSLLLHGRIAALARLPEDAISEVNRLSRALFDVLDRDDRQSYTITPSERFATYCRAIREDLAALARVARNAAIDHTFPPSKEDPDPEKRKAAQRKRVIEARQIEKYVNRIANLADSFRAFEESDEGYHVLFVEKGTSIKIKRAPILIAESLRRALWAKWPVVATSATLATAGDDFGYFRSRNGAPQGPTIAVAAPFDYARNGLLYLATPATMADSNASYGEQAEVYFRSLAANVLRLLEASRGRAFVLFTSRRALQRTYEALRDQWDNIIVQGQTSTQEALKAFRATDRAALFGLRTFMTGVDVQGDALSLVIIDKLPFPPPDEPIYNARCQAIARATGNERAAFYSYTIPLATITLKQASGRLIRTTTDRGVVAILDTRLVTRGYGAGMVRSLPPLTETRDIREVESFFRSPRS